jgi:hypothetical protein
MLRVSWLSQGGGWLRHAEASQRQLQPRRAEVAFIAFLTLLLVASPLISACGGDAEEENGAGKKKEIVVR